MKEQKDYYLGLDVGTDSVGYAVTGEDYALLKHKGEPMWGVHLFEGGQDAAERRAHRTARRRIDRRQQRVSLVEELFAPEIGKVDPQFFLRRRASAMYGEDYPYAVRLFDGGNLSDKAYHRRYPTIHHLILELMTSDAPHDVRLVFLACAWLVAHRGHFLFDIDGAQTEELLDFNKVYTEFCEYFRQQEYALPWDAKTKADTVLRILQMETGVTKKKEAFKEKVYGGKKIIKEATEQFPYSAEALVTLLSGGKVKPAALFNNAEYDEVESVSLQMGDEDFDRIVSELGEDGELLCRCRALQSCAKLIATMANKREQDPVCISSSKVAIYEQHKKDLAFLKRFVKKYCAKQYNDIFRKATADNYVAYSKNVKSCPEPEKVKGTGKEAFCDFLRKRLKDLKVAAADKKAYEDMMRRLESATFLPKQKDTDNRIVPQQLYRQEMAALLHRAEGYLPMLTKKDAEGLTVTQKLLSVFDFRIPYYVGPLVNKGGNAWIERKAGRILPWNFDALVDRDVSEQRFIKRMTNSCTYLPGEEVLPACSLLYEKFMVLNELNNLKVDGCLIPVSVKQELYTQLFVLRPRVTVAQIRKYLLCNGHITESSQLSGLDITVKSGLKTLNIFRRMLDGGILTEADVEKIVKHRAYTEDKSRMTRWLRQNFPQLQQQDVAYILRQDLKGFGRLSDKLLCGIYGAEEGSDGEAFTIIEAMWDTNENLMQLLSERYSFRKQIEEFGKAYYAEHPKSLADRLSEMYVSNAVKRPIFRTLDIVSDVVKATGCGPKKIFVEMARGAAPDQKGKRTQSRKDQLIDLYKTIKTEEARHFQKALEEMGVAAENRLQDRKLYLYYLQLGKCMYTGKAIDLSRLADGSYNLEHIYPQSQVKDDSLLNNLVLVESEANGQKSDTYPVSPEVQKRMGETWWRLKECGLMTAEKYQRLIRKHPFTAEEKMGFINRQLVETRQSTKVIASLLQERFPDAEVVYVKAGMVSEFRQEFDMLKCRAVNDLHHAKDAYLNVVVGNVYHERFTKKWFRLEEPYNVQAKKLFAATLRHGDRVYWSGESGVAAVRKVMEKNAIHLTRYAFFRKGGFFDQMPLKKSAGLIPLKAGLDTEKYGGYNKPAATCFFLARFEQKGVKEIILVSLDLKDKVRALTDPAFAKQCVSENIRKVTNADVDKLELLLGGRPLKVNTLLSLDGARMVLAGKSSGGSNVLLSPLCPLIVSPQWERYIKALEAFQTKLGRNKNLVPDGVHDGITAEKNLQLYQLLAEKMAQKPYSAYPCNQAQTLQKGNKKFGEADLVAQCLCLLNIVQLMGSGSGGADLSVAGGTKSAGAKATSAKLSNWKKRYQDVRILDLSASGLYEKRSANLLELL